ncbi:MAG: DUF1425 domain-containing protein [Planctomycetes bacterium]|nr:DUF1425 domain-containing protein [Planctomycetota bacterium]
MRFISWTLIAVVMAGCGGRRRPEPYPVEPVRSTNTEFAVDPTVYDEPRTSELGTNRTRGIAKTIEWQEIGTELGTTYCAGAVVVDQILREDAQDFYGVRVRLKNTRSESLTVGYQIRFYSVQGEALIGFRTDWRSAVVEPFGYETVTDACRLKGAVGFRLFVRLAGTAEEGLPDGFGKR